MPEADLPIGVISFGVFKVDLRSGELRKNGVKVRLQDQPFRLLRLLLEHPGELVTREELQRQIWPSDTFVDFDRGLNNAVKCLREALGDPADTATSKRFPNAAIGSSVRCLRPRRQRRHVFSR